MGNTQALPRTPTSTWRKSLHTDGVGPVRNLACACRGSRGGKEKPLKAGVRDELRKNKSIVRFSGVQVRWLVAYWGDIRDGKIAGDVKLVVAKEQLADDVWVGRTINANGRVPYRKSGELQSFTAAQVTEKPREDWTISDVRDFVIIPSVMELQCFFTETLASEHVGQPFQGAFVSQAHTSLFADLVAALTRHYTKDGAQDIPADAFVWLDLFCANQPLLTQQGDGATDAVKKERADLLTRGLHLAIEQFEERLLFFDSLLTPALLKRMWCVWEIYGAIKSKEEMTIIFAPGEEDKFVDAIIDDPKKIAGHVAKIRPDQAQCFDEKDQEMVKAAVEGSVGWPKLKQMIMEQLNTWMLLVAEEAVRRAAAMEGSGESKAFGRLLTRAGTFMMDNGQLDIALSYYEKAVGVAVAMRGTEEHKDVAVALGNLAVVYVLQGQLDKALETHQRSLGIKVTVYGTEENTSVARTLGNMGIVYEAQGKLNKALETYQRSLDIKVAAYGTEENTSVARTLGNMGIVYEAQGKLDKALETYQRSHSIFVATYGTEEHAEVGRTLGNMASVFQQQCKLDRALETYQRSLDINVAAYGTEEHAKVGRTLNNMGVVYEAQGKLDEALEMYQRSLDIKVTTYGTEEHTDVARTLMNMAIVYDAQGKLDKALETYQRSLDIFVAAYGTEEHTDVATTLGNMAIVYHAQGKLGKTLETFQRSLDIFVAAYGTEDHTSVAITLSNMALAYKAQGKLDKALEKHQRSFDIKVAAYGTEERTSVARALSRMAEVQIAMGAKDDALVNAERALAIWTATLSADSKDMEHTRALVADLSGHGHSSCSIS